MRFISEEYFSMHTEFVNSLKLRLSVIERNLPVVSGREVTRAMLRSRNMEVKSAAELLCEIKLHEIFFDSFCEREYVPSTAAKNSFGSEASLINDIYRLAVDVRCGFVGVCLDRNRQLELFSAEKSSDAFLHGRPLLALDMCEHAYFGDYGFDKERYISAALRSMNLCRLDAFC